MVELLLTLALAAVMLPFLVNFQRDRIERAKNVALSQQMEQVQSALERYIDIHKRELLIPVGKNITRVNVNDLVEYGAPAHMIELYGDDFQIRILKSSDRQNHATLQGVIVLHDKDISPLRTREIINMGGDKMGFVEGGKTYGAFGTWHNNVGDFGISGDSGLIETTKTTLDAEQYLLRIPSVTQSDATMQSALNLSGHNVINAKFFDVSGARFEEFLKSDTIVADKIVFQSRTTLDKAFEATDALVAGTLSSDSKNMDVANTLALTDSGKFTNFVADNLWVTNLNLSGLTVSSSAKAPVLKINQTIDMVGGHIAATYVTVGFTGSITPKLVIKNRIEDSTNSSFYWDMDTNTARLYDVSLAELNRMAPLSSRAESDGKTAASQIFGIVSANRNATAADFMNAISEIQKRVGQKYRQLNLE